MALAGVLAALLAPFQFYFFPATYLIVLLLVVARRAWRRQSDGGRPTWPRDALLFLVPIVLALPFIVGPALQQGAKGAFKFVVGWRARRSGTARRPSPSSTWRTWGSPSRPRAGGSGRSS